MALMPRRQALCLALTLTAALVTSPVVRADWSYLYGEVGDGNGLLDLSMPDERTACAVGVHQPGGAGSNSEALVICTDNGGETWRPYRLSGTMIMPTAVHMPTAQIGFMTTMELSGFSVVAKVHRSDDGGRSWTAQTLPGDVAGVLGDVFFLDADHGWTAGAPGMFYTVDGGSNWSRASLPDLGPDRQIEGIHFVDAQHGVAVGGQAGQEAEDEWSDPVPACCGFVLGSSDGGQTWSMLADGFEQSLRRVHFTDAQRGWMAGGGTSGVILHTVDGGVSWIPQTVPPGAFGSPDMVSDLIFVDEQTGYAVASIGEGTPMVFRTEDGGALWTQDQSYDAAFEGLTGFEAFARYSRLIALDFPAPGRGMVCGKNAIVVALAGEGFCADADADGYRDEACGGDDCDDQNAWLSPGAEELCNGLDDNCDGVADDGIDLDRDPRNCGECGFNCQPAQVCWDGLCATDCPSELSRCGQECVDLASDVRHCGQCDHACAPVHGTAECLAGDCQLSGCDEGFWDLDGQVENGCEYACQPTGGEECNRIDDDCDGVVDEGLNDCDSDGGVPDGGTTDGGTGGDGPEFREPTNSGGCSQGGPGALWALLLLGLLPLTRRGRIN